MNKKVSTLLTASLLMMSPVFGSIFAQNQVIPVSSAEDNVTYLLQATHYYADGIWTEHKPATISYVAYDSETGKYFLTTKSTEATYWTVSKTGSSNSDYVFTSKTTGSSLSVADANGKNGASAFALEPNSSQTGDAVSLKWTGKDDNQTYFVGHDGKTTIVGAYTAAGAIAAENAGTYLDAFKLVEIEDETVESGLNDLYNKKGFNFTVDGKLKDVPVDGNLFNEEGSTIWAFYLGTPQKVGEAKDKNNNEVELVFPVGTYFFVDRVLNDTYKNGEIKQMTEDDSDVWLYYQYRSIKKEWLRYFSTSNIDHDFYIFDSIKQFVFKLELHKS